MVFLIKRKSRPKGYIKKVIYTNLNSSVYRKKPFGIQKLYGFLKEGVPNRWAAA